MSWSLFETPSATQGQVLHLPADVARECTRRPALLPDARCGLMCVVITALAYLLTWPLANLSFDDDWTFAFTVKRLTETGRLIYNGWSSPSIIVQAYWGMLWVKLFGFSFNVLRLSTLPLALGSVWLVYLLARRAGLTTGMAMFAALSVGCSPLFLPLAASFMSDVPGLLFILLSLYALIRAGESQSRASAATWILIGVAAALVGGTSRQIVWIVPLAVLPYIAWWRRSDRQILAAAAVGWVIVFAGAIAIQNWFNHQPFALPESSPTTYLIAAIDKPAHTIMGLVAVLLTTLLLTLPACVLLLQLRVRMSDIGGTALIVIAFGCVVWLRHEYALLPWMRNIITISGVLGATELAPDRPIVLLLPIRIALSLLVYLIAAVGVWSVLRKLFRPRAAIDQFRRFFERREDRRITLPAMALFAAAYLVLLVTRAAVDLSYDRHVLPLVACAAVMLLAIGKHRGRVAMPLAAWALLAVFSLYAVATTQEVNALAAARAIAAQRLVQAGVPRTRFVAGFEYDGWTELLTTGYINDPRIENPPGAFHRGLERTPSIVPLYILQSRVTADTEQTRFESVRYFSLLPPFQRTVMINRFVDPWWFDSVRAATRPVSRRHLVIAPSMRLPD